MNDYRVGSLIGLYLLGIFALVPKTLSTSLRQYYLDQVRWVFSQPAMQAPHVLQIHNSV